VTSITPKDGDPGVAKGRTAVVACELSIARLLRLKDEMQLLWRVMARRGYSDGCE